MMTTVVQVNDGKLDWPSRVPDDAYMIAYLHSELKVGRKEDRLDSAVLYEAWAFDGRVSWHLWQRDGEWVCTECDTSHIAPQHSMRTKQYLSREVKRLLKEQHIDKQFLEVHETIAFDADGQAYIAYGCPINFL